MSFNRPVATISLHVDESSGLPFSLRIILPPDKQAKEVVNQLRTLGNEVNVSGNIVDVKPNVKLHRVFGNEDPLQGVQAKDFDKHKDKLRALQKNKKGLPEGLSFYQGLETILQVLKDNAISPTLDKKFLMDLENAINMYIMNYNIEPLVEEEKEGIDQAIGPKEVLNQLTAKDLALRSALVSIYLQERKQGKGHDEEQSALQNTLATVSDIAKLPQLLNAYNLKPDLEDVKKSQYFKDKLLAASQNQKVVPAPTSVSTNRFSTGAIQKSTMGGGGSNKAAGEVKLNNNSGSAAAKGKSTNTVSSVPKPDKSDLQMARLICDNCATLSAPTDKEIADIAKLLKGFANEDNISQIKEKNRLSSEMMKGFLTDKNKDAADQRKKILDLFGSVLISNKKGDRFKQEIAQATVAVLTFSVDEIKKIKPESIPRSPDDHDQKFADLLLNITVSNIERYEQEAPKRQPR